jgi:hypothetical protein
MMFMTRRIERWAGKSVLFAVKINNSVCSDRLGPVRAIGSGMVKLNTEN